MEFLIELNGILTEGYLNMLPLGSYGILVGMDWLEVHRDKLDYYDKGLECINNEG